MKQIIATAVMLTSIILIAGCSTSSKPDLTGVWTDSSNAKLEFQKDGTLVCHPTLIDIKVSWNIENTGIPASRVITNNIILAPGEVMTNYPGATPSEKNTIITGNWNLLNDSTVVMTFSLPNETMFLTNNIQMISENTVVFSDADYSHEFSRKQ
jgi:hypothetical protein